MFGPISLVVLAGPKEMCREIYDMALLLMPTNGVKASPLSETEVENLDVFGMFAFPLVFSRFIEKHYPCKNMTRGAKKSQFFLSKQ